MIFLKQKYALSDCYGVYMNIKLGVAVDVSQTVSLGKNVKAL